MLLILLECMVNLQVHHPWHAAAFRQHNLVFWNKSAMLRTRANFNALTLVVMFPDTVAKFELRKVCHICCPHCRGSEPACLCGSVRISFFVFRQPEPGRGKRNRKSVDAAMHR